MIRDTAISKAVPFFINARDNTNDSTIASNCDMYIKIAEFNDKIRNFKDDNDRANNDVKDIIEEYVSSLEQLADSAENSTSNKVKLNAYAVIQSGLNNNATDFKSAGISKNRIDNLVNKATSGLNTLSFQASVYKQAKAKCQSSLQIAASRIERAYSNSSVGNK